MSVGCKASFIIASKARSVAGVLPRMLGARASALSVEKYSWSASRQAREHGSTKQYLLGRTLRFLLQGSKRRTRAQTPDCVAGHVRFEIRNVEANYPFERLHRFAGIQPNSGFGDHSRLSCSAEH